jgi:hypothetical protein
VRRLAIALVAVACAAGVARGHGKSVSYSTITLGPARAHVELRMTALDATLTGLDPWQDADALGRWAAERLVVAPCTPSVPRTAPPHDGNLVIAWDVTCDGPPTTITTRLFADQAPSHLHFARVTMRDGRVAERVLTEGDRVWPLAQAAAPAHGSSFADYVALGVEHIRTGYDHLAFVLALVLLAGSLAEVGTIVSAFTLAHSVTLAAAVLGVVQPAPAAVEALIGFSIALVAFENAWLLAGRDRTSAVVASGFLVVVALAMPGAVGPIALLGLALFTACHLGLLAVSERPARLRALVAFAFGLIHGFAFAGVLAEMDLPRARLVPALVGFNVGVELGQLAIVAVAWAALLAVERAVPGGRRRVAEAGSAAVCGLGLYWFVTRL